MADDQQLPSSRTITFLAHEMIIVRFIDRRSPQAQWGEYVLQFQLEAILYGATFTTTGAVYRLLRRAGVGHHALPIRRACVAEGLLSDQEYDQLKSFMNLPSLRFFTLIPLDAMQAAIALYGSTPTSRAMLDALEMPQPAEWASGSGSRSSGSEGEGEGGAEADADGEEEGEEEGDEEAQAHEDDEEEGEEDGNDGDNGADGSGSPSSGDGASGDSRHSRSRSHHGSDGDAYPPTEEEEGEPQEAGHSPASDAASTSSSRRTSRVPAFTASAKLEAQLKALARHRSATINRQRQGAAAASTTIAEDRKSLLHFFAWLVAEKKSITSPTFGVFTSQSFGAVAQQFVENKQQTCKHARIAKLLAALVSAARFTAAALKAKAAPSEAASRRSLDDLTALHAQCLAEARQETKFGIAAKPAAWLDWTDCQRARQAAERTLDEDDGGNTTTTLELTRDVCVLTVLTGMPPDRVGVYRKLKIGTTLVKTSEGAYQLDLSLPGQHKTSSVFGPQVTMCTPRVAAAIGALVAADQLQDGECLFHQATDRTVPLATTAWSRLVKGIFAAYSTDGVRFNPKDCRASFITWLRSGEHGDDVLASAAKQMRHSSVMAASATYDKEKTSRVLSRASEAAEAFAKQYV